MNHIAKALCRISRLQANKDVLLASKTFVRQSSITTWNKDWKPGPYPRTEEEKIAAARKYNLLPEDYEPYPEEEGFGDYPKFPPLHMEDRSDFEAYDFPHLKRNFGEPVHPDMEILLEDKINWTKKLDPPIWKMFLYVATGFSIYTLIMLWDNAHPYNHRKVPKQYPLTGQTSYTFEPAD
ncbi:NADH dehydrogenase [ubiquinone] 1 beta subcomplex subunit 8, mitochondrial-like [Uloborus diversus]|uniref:NADH dehydrogenase [ubiquinone] 1 beta subcomplex subunit 8, mitochondrial-like n=1 Tax=Uloborus diversus TaxID=327109 RepID=UPI00240A8D01|nr:NADH dehydrogenase [ubiquinone] 1 beta subcomplex subunit 8, mitochondrial-like [Uloborus diversus]